MKFSFFTCLLAWETQEANAKPSITNRFLNACIVNNVLSVVSGTYSGKGGRVGFRARGESWGGGGDRDVKWEFHVLGFLVF